MRRGRSEHLSSRLVGQIDLCAGDWRYSVAAICVDRLFLEAILSRRCVGSVKLYVTAVKSDKRYLPSLSIAEEIYNGWIRRRSITGPVEMREQHLSAATHFG